MSYFRKGRRSFQNFNSKPKISAFTIRHDSDPTAFQTAIILYKGFDKDNQTKLYEATTMGNTFEIKVEPEDYERGEVTIQFKKKEDFKQLKHYIYNIISIFKQQGWTGTGLTYDELEEDFMNNPNKKLLDYDVID